jgi:hypothetical protein
MKAADRQERMRHTMRRRHSPSVPAHIRLHMEANDNHRRHITAFEAQACEQLELMRALVNRLSQSWWRRLFK